MPVPGMFKLGLVSTMLHISHLDFMHFLAGKGWSSVEPDYITNNRII